jgi:phosphoribosyl-ATP pyrophosphohydrolase
MADTALHQLMAVIADRKATPSEASYTSRLLAGGVEAIGAKILEEAREVTAAAAEAGQQGHDHLVHEAADLIYHLWVLLAHGDVELEEVEAELRRRFGVSGLEEKASRRQGGDGG